MLAYTRRSRAISMLETVVIIVVVGLVGAVAVRAWARARENARSQVCTLILKRYGEAFAAYAADHGNVLPYENVNEEHLGHVVWYDALATYMGTSERRCPSVSDTAHLAQEGYRLNSKLGKWTTDPPRPYRALDSLDSTARTVILFDVQYGGKFLSLKGGLKDADYRHNGSLNVLFADWHVDRYEKEHLVEASNWLPPKVIWDPDVGKPPTVVKRKKR